MREGTFLYKHDFDPYAGGVFYHVRSAPRGHADPKSPLYLLFFSYVVDIESSILTALLWTVVDVVGAILLVQVWRSRRLARTYPGRDHIVALLFVGSRCWPLTSSYLFNPYTLLSCLARSTTSLDNVMCLFAIASSYVGESESQRVAGELASFC